MTAKKEKSEELASEREREREREKFGDREREVGFTRGEGTTEI